MKLYITTTVLHTTCKEEVAEYTSCFAHWRGPYDINTYWSGGGDRSFLFLRDGPLGTSCSLVPDPSSLPRP